MGKGRQAGARSQIHLPDVVLPDPRDTGLDGGAPRVGIQREAANRVFNAVQGTLQEH